MHGSLSVQQDVTRDSSAVQRIHLPVTKSSRRATRQTCGINSGFGFSIYDYQTSYWQYNALEYAVSNDNLDFFIMI